MYLETREQWLNAAVELFRPLFINHPQGDIPRNLRVSCRWPSKRAFAKTNRRIGECWDSAASADDTHKIFISPYLWYGPRVLDVLAHELVHTCVGVKAGHKKPFIALAKAIGLKGKMTATAAGPSLKAFCITMAGALGDYPHKMLDKQMINGEKKQGTRMLKLECSCGYVVRTTQKWIDVGLPTCCCGKQFA
jgi:hypothetical protein